MGEMGKLIPLSPPRPSRAVEPETELRPAPDRADLELLPVAGLLFAASLVRVAHALWRHEAFDVEPTVALFFVLGLPWLAIRSRAKRP